MCDRGRDPEVLDALLRALDVLCDLGAVVVEFQMPALDDMLRDFPNLSYVETALVHESTFPARQDEYSPAWRAQLEAGAQGSGPVQPRAELGRRRFSAELASTRTSRGAPTLAQRVASRVAARRLL